MNIVLLICLACFVGIDTYITKRDKYVFLSCIALAAILNMNAAVSNFLNVPEYKHLLMLRRFCQFIGYAGRPVLLWGLWEMLRGDKKRFVRNTFAALAIGNMLVFTTVFWSNLSVGFEADTYNWTRGPLGYTSHIVMVIMMMLFVPILVDMFLHEKRQDFIAGLLALLLVLGTTVLDTVTDSMTLLDAITYECVLYFMFLHLRLEEEYSRTRLVAQKAEMMLMQIQPHFINNALGTIQALCDIDPALAAQTTGTFAKYLRGNLTVMDKTMPVPIEEELAHTRAYMDIEILRFPWIEVEYDIQDTNFCVPALSVQPLLENAVQHGLRKRKHGRVTIRTRQSEEGHLVEVIDNGEGFDINNPVTEADHGIALKNVNFRIEAISHGRMKVESSIGEGTKVTLIIP